MTKLRLAPSGSEMKALLLSDENGFRAVLQSALQEVLEAEMTEALGAAKSERTAERVGDRSGYYDRELITRVDVLELRVPHDRAGHFSTELFERYQRSEKALVSALAEMYVQAFGDELDGHLRETGKDFTEKGGRRSEVVDDDDSDPEIGREMPE